MESKTVVSNYNLDAENVPTSTVWILLSFAFKSFVTQVGCNSLLLLRTNVETKSNLS